MNGEFKCHTIRRNNSTDNMWYSELLVWEVRKKCSRVKAEWNFCCKSAINPNTSLLCVIYVNTKAKENFFLHYYVIFWSRKSSYSDSATVHTLVYFIHYLTYNIISFQKNKNSVSYFMRHQYSSSNENCALKRCLHKRRS